PRRRLDHIHRWSGHFRWGRVLCTYRRSGHGARPAKVLELGAEELLGTSLAEKSPRLRAIYVVARGLSRLTLDEYWGSVKVLVGTSGSCSTARLRTRVSFVMSDSSSESGPTMILCGSLKLSLRSTSSGL